MDRIDHSTRQARIPPGESTGTLPGTLCLQRSVADTLRTIAAACAERDAPPVKAARRELAAAYGATRLRRQRDRQRAAG